MRLGPNTSAIPVVLLGLSILLASNGAVLGAPPPRGKPIQFADPESSGTTTNLDKLATKPDNLSPYREGANLPQAGPNSMTVMPPVLPAALRPLVVPTKQTRELLERRKNWDVLSKDEIMDTRDDEQAMSRLRGASDRDKEAEEQLTPEERRKLDYARGNRNPALTRNRDYSSNQSNNSQDSYNQDPSSTDPRDTETEQRKKPAQDSVFGDSADSLGIFAPPREEAPKSLFPEFAPGFQRQQTREEAQAQRARMDTFRQLYGLPAAAPTTSELLKQLNAPPEKQRSGPAALPTFGTIAPQTGSELPSAPFGTAGAAKLPEITRPTLAPSLAPTLPPTDFSTPKVTPPTPTFTAPKRPF